MKSAKILALLDRTATVLLIVFTACVMAFTLVFVNTVDKKDTRLFGCQFYTVLSDSMKDEFRTGDLVVCRQVDPASLQAGDIITFQSIDPGDHYGEVVTHAIREVTDYEGTTAFVTYGTANEADDPYPVPSDRVLGQYWFRLPGAGYAVLFLKSTAGYITLIFLPFLLLLLLQGARFVRQVKEYRADQQADMDRQKAEIEAEKQKAQEMLAELQRLRRQTGEKEGPAGAREQVPERAEDAAPGRKRSGQDGASQR